MGPKKTSQALKARLIPKPLIHAIPHRLGLAQSAEHRPSSPGTPPSGGRHPRHHPPSIIHFLRSDTRDCRLAQIIRKCQDFPGQELFPYEPFDAPAQLGERTH